MESRDTFKEGIRSPRTGTLAHRCMVTAMDTPNRTRDTRTLTESEVGDRMRSEGWSFERVSVKVMREKDGRKWSPTRKKIFSASTLLYAPRNMLFSNDLLTC